MLLLTVLTQVADDPGLPVAQLLNYGLAGLVILLMLIGYMYPKPMVDYLRTENKRLREDNQELRTENTQLHTSIANQVTPALGRMTSLLERLSEKGFMERRPNDGGS